MKRDPTPARKPGPAALLVAAVAMFVAITAVRMLVTVPGFGITLLYDVPVALVAMAFGLRAGLTAAVVAFALFVLGDVTRPIVVDGTPIPQNVAGYASRALVLAMLGGVLGFYSDRLRRSERVLGGVLESVHDAIVTADGSGRVIAFNQAAEREFGLPVADALGESLTILMPERFHAAHEAGMARYLATREAKVIGQTVELVGRRRNGEEFPLELALTTFQLQRETFFTGILTNIGERREIERQRAAYQTGLERSNDELEQFAYVASHDLQEPLRSIGGFVQLLDRRYRGQIDEEADRYISFVVAGVERMQSLIDDLLVYARAGRADLQREPTDTGEVMQRALAALDAAVRESAAVIEVGELPTLAADRRALGQVFQNLLGNALKFTNGEHPHVAVSAARQDDAWCFSVADNGIGIDPAHEERIFRMFQRLHARDEYGGTGIGLALCKRIVDRHGGRIWCGSRPGGGTVFRFTIPDAEPATT